MSVDCIRDGHIYRLYENIGLWQCESCGVIKDGENYEYIRREL